MRHVTKDTEQLHDLHCKNAADMYSRILADRVRELKETQKEVDIMCNELEEIYSEGIESGERIGIEKGELKKARETAISLSEMGLPVNKIAQAIKVNVDTVQEWLEESLHLVH